MELIDKRVFVLKGRKSKILLKRMKTLPIKPCLLMLITLNSDRVPCLK